MATFDISGSRRKIFLVTLMFFFLLGVLAVAAQGAENIRIFLDGKQVNSEVSPFIDGNGRTMVPLRFIAENLGADVDWSKGIQKITIEHKKQVIELTIGNNKAVVNGKTVSLDTEPVIVSNTTMVPLRFIGEQMGSLVSWSSREQAVYISTTGDPGNTGDVKEEVVVTVSTANIRQGPGTGYPIISQVHNGTVLGSLGASGGWYKVLLADNSTGWISGTIVKLKNDDGNEPDPGNNTNPGINGDSVIFIASSVNIRTGPSTSYDIVGQASKGMELAVLGKQGSWIKVRTTSGGEGWVANWLVGYKKKPGGGQDAPLRGKIVVIDPGHGSLQSGGGSDPGAVSPSGVYERDVVTNISMAAGEALSGKGATVVYTRIGASTQIDLNGRAVLANNLGADAFVAIHCNSSTSSSAAGTSTYYYTPAGTSQTQSAARKQLATLVQQELVQALGRKNLGILQANFAVLRCTTVPSILVETAFLSNAQEEALLRTAAFQKKAGEAVARGVAEFLTN